jgi:tetratricopeptide (TPR) repeat protein
VLAALRGLGLSELGVVGLVLLLAALAGPIAAIARAATDPLGPAAAGAYTAFLVHAGFDWDWEMPVLVVAALSCGAALLVAARGGRPGKRPPAGARSAALVSVLALGALAYVVLIGNLTTTRARDAAALGALQEARAHAREAAKLAPWSAVPWSIVGEAALAQGDTPLARASFRRGLEHDPRSWRLWAGLATASRGAARRAAIARARRLNPLGSPRIRPTR